MIELVINAPHLQTFGQRLAAVALNGFGWLLWCYFFFPLVSLGCWFLDYAQCSQWVDLSGGYSHLRGMLLVYAETVAAMMETVAAKFTGDTVASLQDLQT